MKVVAINGSHRAGKSTSVILQSILADFEGRGWQTELVELSKVNIDFCIGCNSCLMRKPCPLVEDDFGDILKSIEESDAIILGSPNYFLNVTARMKNFMDRMRPPHLAGDVLADKVAGLVVTTGLNNAGADCAVNVLERFCDGQGWIKVGGSTVVASWEEGLMEDGRAKYRKTAALDPRGIEYSKKLVERVDELCRAKAACEAAQ